MSAVIQPTHPQIAVSAAIFRDGKVLLTRRARSPAKGFYSLPGGRVEFGESLHRRWRARSTRRPGSPSRSLASPAGARCCRPPGAGHYLIMSFAARWVAREPALNDELDDYRWIAPTPWRASATSS
ncbi:NUDIX domain-containing protein [Bradyrhizobium japonicum]